MEPIDYLKILQRRWRLPAALCLLGVVAAWITSPREARTEDYQATYTFVVNAALRQTLNQAGTLSRAQELMTVGEVPKRAAAELGEDDPAALTKELSVTVLPDAGTLRLTSTQRDPARAAAVANAFGQALASRLDGEAQRRHQQALDAANASINQIQPRIKELDVALVRGTGDPTLLRAQRDVLVRQYGVEYERIQQLTRTGPTPELVSLGEAIPVAIDRRSFQPPSNPWVQAALAGGLGLLLGAGLALVLERFDTRIRTKDDAEEAFGLPVIAEIPAMSRRERHRTAGLPTVTRPSSPVTESYRTLRTSLMRMPMFAGGKGVARRANAVPEAGTSAETSATLPEAVAADGNDTDELPVRGVPAGSAAAPGSAAGTSGSGSRAEAGRAPKVILVTSPGPLEGKTTVVANLAVSFAEIGTSVLIVSCDFRRPRAHRLFDVPDAPGLSDLLLSSDAASLSGKWLQALARTTPVPGVRLVPSGTPIGSPARLLEPERRLLGVARELADVVIIDSAPFLVANDASDLLPTVDAVLMVARSGKTTIESARRAGGLLSRLGAPPLGVVVVAAPDVPLAPGYYYRDLYRPDESLAWRPMNQSQRPPAVRGEIDQAPSPEPDPRPSPDHAGGNKGDAGDKSDDKGNDDKSNDDDKGDGYQVVVDQATSSNGAQSEPAQPSEASESSGPSESPEPDSAAPTSPRPRRFGLRRQA